MLSYCMDISSRQAGDMLIYGVNPVLEALRARAVIKIFVSAKREDIPHILSLARERGVPVDRVAPSFFEALPKGHQSVAAKVREKSFMGTGEMLEAAAKVGEPPLLVALDGVEDPRNLGAIMRSALALGAHGIIIGKHRQSGLTPEAFKASAGAAWSLPVSREANIKYALDMLKENGLVVAGTAAGVGVAPRLQEPIQAAPSSLPPKGPRQRQRRSRRPQARFP